MRIITSTIRNLGTGDITWVADHLDHGVWSDRKSPTNRAKLIKASGEGMFESRDGGDIPIIGSIGTGTQGWVLFRTLCSESVGSTTTIFMKISWNIPFVSFDAPTDGLKVELTRYDPRATVTSGEFDERDRRRPPLQISMSVAGAPGGDHVTDALPWVFTFPPFVVTGAKIGVNVTLDVRGTVSPADTTIPPFPSGQSGRRSKEPTINTNSTMWTGHWAGRDVSVRIGKAGDGSLNVVVQEPSGRFACDRVQISRITLSQVIPRATRLPQVGGHASGEAGVRLMSSQPSVAPWLSTRSIAAENKISFNPSAAGGISTSVASPSDAIPADAVFAVGMDEGVSSRTMATKSIDPDSAIYRSVVSSKVGSISMLPDGRHQIGGDYLSLPPEATLEMYSIREGTREVDLNLRYRRPAHVPFVSAAGQVDEMLQFYPDVR
jgi:hypothetical protein